MLKFQLCTLCLQIHGGGKTKTKQKKQQQNTLFLTHRILLYVLALKYAYLD